MLLHRVGRPKSPTCAGNGGRWRGRPRLPSIDFEHRRFLAADIGARTPAQMDARIRSEPGRGERRDLAVEDRMALRVFVAQVDIDVGGLDHPGGDQHPFEKAMRVGFEKMAVLEGAGLALVAVDREEARGRLLAHQAPFAPGRKTGAAEPAQPGMLERLDQLLGSALAGKTGLQQAIAARGAIGIETDKGRQRRMRFAGGDRGRHPVRSRVLVQRMADCDDRGAVAAAHARRADNAHPAAEPALQVGEQHLGAGELAAEAVAHPHR